jgi:hypothetical protein
MDERLGWLAKKKTHKVPRIKVRVEREQCGRIAELCVLAYEKLDGDHGKNPDLSDPAYWESKRKAMEAYHLIKKVGLRYKVREDCAIAKIDENETNVLVELGIEFEILETTSASGDLREDPRAQKPRKQKQLQN